MSLYNLGPSIGSGLAFLLGGAVLAFAGEAAVLVIVVVGLGPVALLSRIGRRGRSDLLG